MLRPDNVRDALTTGSDDLVHGNFGDLTLYSAYQPIFKPSPDGAPQIFAVEGLVRPFRDGQAVSPDAFFSAIEPVDALFAECLCQALHVRNYRTARPNNLSLFLNINPAVYESPKTLEREFTFMIRQLPKYGLSEGQVVFELLETAPCSFDILDWLRVFARDNAVQFAIDDFGRGHSNLARYEALKPDVVKIDGNLFARSSQNADQGQFLHSVIKRVHDDGGTVVIEGIETAEMQDAAIEIGGDYLQGFHLGRPQILPHDFSG